MTTFQSEWEGFAEAFMPMVEFGTGQYNDMQITFFSGAFILRRLYLSCDENAEVAVKQIDDWGNEIFEFLKLVQQHCDNAQAVQKPMLDKRQRRKFEIDMMALHASGYGEEACVKICEHIAEPIRPMTICIFKTCLSLGIPSQSAFGLAVKMSKTISTFSEQI
jgi:hypothetical protein